MATTKKGLVTNWRFFWYWLLVAIVVEVCGLSLLQAAAGKASFSWIEWGPGPLFLFFIAAALAAFSESSK